MLIDIPKDVQIAQALWHDGPPQRRNRYSPQTEGGAKEIARAIDLIGKAQAPIFYTGGGVINSGPQAAQLLRQFQALTGAPVTTTLMGLGAFPADHPDWLGMLGMHGTYESNMAMNRADLIVCIGARFDDRVTGRLDAFSPNSTKIHIDIDRSSINKTVAVDLPIVGDCGRRAGTADRSLGQPQGRGPQSSGKPGSTAGARATVWPSPQTPRRSCRSWRCSGSMS